MRRFVPAIALALIGAMTFSLVGCGVKQPQDNISESGSELNTGTDNTGNSETESESESESVIETEPETETGTESGEYTFTELDKTMWATTGVNVRRLPSTDGEKLGVLAQGQEVKVTGKCNENGWWRVEYNGAIGYVSGSYLSDNKEVNNIPVPGEPNATVDSIRDVVGKTPKKVGSIYVIGNAGFEGYTFSSTIKGRADSYAELMTKAADALKGVSNVYVMPIPLGSGITLPDEYKGKVSVADQGAAIDYILSKMGDNVVPVDIYEKLYEHRDEYLYFRTDHHWTQLGAYYAYTKYCEAKGITPHTLDQYTHKAYGGFVGSFYFNYNENYASTVNALNNASDTIYTYAPISNAKMTYTDKNGKQINWPIIKDVSSYGKGVKYSCFIAGDNPYTIIKNSDITDGSSCIVVKESYGNAFVPFLVDHYQTIHVIDQRYWKGNVVEFAKENHVQDVIFANNLTAIGSQTQLKYFKGLID